jgi:hypothetical protein
MWITRLMATYVGRDLSGFMRVISDNFTQDSSILRNAISADFQSESNANVDIELLEYRMTQDTIQVKIRWNRTATDQKTGATSVQTGTATLLFDRRDNFRLMAWLGLSPFGLTDAQWTQQAAAGDPSVSSESGPISGSGSLGLVNLDGTGPNHQSGFIIDLDERNGRTAVGNGSNPLFLSGISALPTGDMVIQFQGSGSTSTSAFLVTPNHESSSVFPTDVARFAKCSSNPQLSDVKGINEEAISSGISEFLSPIPFGTPTRFVIAYKTNEGRFGVIELDFLALGGSPPSTQSVRWSYRTGRSVGDSVINPQGLVVCP